ncbi:sialate O-acetylesterase [Arenibacter palladensis]|uniref:Sialate O-acetylesterase n=1 Tax=Arenibacter palladensis TaxID=237373 RepID=A0A1M5F1Z6_9FLAO|nr:sialate O-acetylesterase [Arenibacter palladensis]SHF85271.1 sialate O-acetylesterase [Arenibacter palladensis]
MKTFVFILCFFSLVGSKVCAQVRPARIFADHMVLQRDREIPVWGFARPGEVISVKINSKKNTVTTDSIGRWMCKMPSMPAGGPYELSIQSLSDSIILHDVMIGEVWFASGQSNMEHTLGGWPWIPYSQIKNYEQELKDIDYPQIRMFTVPKLASPVEMDDLRGGIWELPALNTLPNFSASAWFFAKELTKALGVSVGIIHSSWGGTAIAPWMDSQAFKTFENDITIPEVPKSFNMDEWVEDANTSWSSYVAFRERISNSGLNRVSSLSNSSQSEAPWKVINKITALDDISSNWIWLKKELHLSDSSYSMEWCLELGYLNRQAHVFLNGLEIGYFLYPKKAKIELPPNALKKGKNVILIRIAQPWGGAKVEGNEFALKSNTEEKKIDIADNWGILKPEVSPKPHGKLNIGSATYLFNGMVAPVIPYAIRGFLWNQGESDAGRSDFYKKAFPALITEWRKRWGIADIPFIFVQSTNYQPSWSKPEESWSRASLRLAQAEALKLPNTSMVVSMDIGDQYDVHPANKQDFGYRMAIQALSKVYGKDIQSDGPRYKSHFIQGNTLIVNLEEVNGLLSSTNNDSICGFELAGKEGEFYDAQARIHGDQIYIASKKIESPIEVRYAWSDNPECFIYDSEELPLAPFSTVY